MLKPIYLIVKSACEVYASKACTQEAEAKGNEFKSWATFPGLVSGGNKLEHGSFPAIAVLWEAEALGAVGLP